MRTETFKRLVKVMACVETFNIFEVEGLTFKINKIDKEIGGIVNKKWFLFKDFQNAINSLTEEFFELEFGEDIIKIRDQGGEFKIDTKDFLIHQQEKPTMEEVVRFKVNTKELQKITPSFAGKDEYRETLLSFLLENNGGKAWATTTDSRRLSNVAVGEVLSGEGKFVLPKEITKMAKIMGREVTIAIFGREVEEASQYYATKSYMITNDFFTAGGEFYSREFLKYECVTKMQDNVRIEFDGKRLLKSIKNLQVDKDAPFLTFSVQGDKMEIKGLNSIVNFRIEKQHETFKFNLNKKYVVQLLQKIKIRGLKTRREGQIVNPINFIEEGNEENNYVIMPIRDPRNEGE